MDDLIIFLLDKSSSMDHLTNETIIGFNSFLKEQKSLPGDAKFSLVLFATESERVYQYRDLQSIPELNSVTYKADGFSTAYLDALGYAIDDVGEYLNKLPESEKPKKVIVVTLTDGLENDSKKYSRQDILQKITHQQQKYSWEFIFLGANMDAVEEGTSMGISATNSVNFAATNKGMRMAFTETSHLVSHSRTST